MSTDCLLPSRLGLAGGSIPMAFKPATVMAKRVEPSASFAVGSDQAFIAKAGQHLDQCTTFEVGREVGQHIAEDDWLQR
jgi:hypothetical protein